jgi:hypothetical protein
VRAAVEAGAVRVAVKRHAFRDTVERLTVPAGATVREIVEVCGLPEPLRAGARVQIDGFEVRAEWFPHTRPKAGALVSVLGCPAGSAGGKGGASIVPQSTQRLFLGLLATAAGAFIPGALGLSGAALYAAQAGISIAGVLVTNALVPPPLKEDERKGYSVSGTRNEMDPFGAVPKVFGRVRYFPKFAAVPATETVGNDQYVNLLLCLGYGPLTVSEPRIGSTRIADMQGVEYEVLPGMGHDKRRSMYMSDVYEETFPVSEEPMGSAPEWGHYELNGATVAAYVDGAVWKPHEEVVLHETANDCERFVLDLTFPEGLVRRQEQRNDPWKVNMHVQFRQAGVRPAGHENAGWIDLIPNAADVVRNRAEEFPSTLDRVYEWLAATEPRLAELYDLLVYSLQYDERLTETQRLGAVLDGMREAMEVLEALRGEDPGQEDTRLAIVFQLGRLIDAMRELVGEGEPSAAMDQWLDETGHYSDFIGAAVEMNRILSLGYGTPEDDARITNAWVRAMIFRQGLEGIFAAPALGGFTCVERRPGVVRFAVQSPPELPKGRYQVRVRRTSEETDSDTISDKVYWTSLRSYKDSVKPFRNPQGQPVALAGLRLKAGEQVSGVLDQFSCVLEAKLPAWDPDTQAWSEPSTEHGHNPAWCYAEVLRGPGSKKPVPDNRIDLENLAEWADYCTANGFRVDTVIDDKTTTLDLLKKIAACGRATYAPRNGKFGVVIDRPQDTPVQVFTARNCRNFTASRAFRTAPHALKVRAVNADAEWQKDEFIVCADGYYDPQNPPADTTGLSPASQYDELELWGVVDSKKDGKGGNDLSEYHTGLAYKHGRYALAQIALRPEVFEFETDAEGPLLAARGLRVKVQHDVIRVGLGAGRIEKLGTHVAGRYEYARVDWPVAMEAGKTYACRVRRNSGRIAEIPLSTVAGTERTLYFQTFWTDAEDPIAEGDLVWYGESGKLDFDCIVKEVHPDADYGARLVCVPYNEAIYTADTGDIPPYDPGITRPPDILVAEPPAPEIAGVQSDETVLVRLPDGTLQSRILVSLKPPQNSLPRGHYIQTVQVHYRPLLDVANETEPESAVTVRDGSWSVISVQVDRHVREVSIAPVADGDWYEFRIRYITNHNAAGPWAHWPGHRVVGKTTPPPDVDTLLFEGARLRWFYPTPPLDLAGFRVRFAHGEGATWETATPAHDGILGGTFYDFNALGGGTLTFFVKAVDVAGNESERAAKAVKSLGDPVLGNIVFTDDHKALSWPAERVGCRVDAVTGELVAEEGAELFWQEGGAPFWGQDDAAFWDSTYYPMEYIVLFTPDPDKLPAVIKIEVEVEGAAWRLEWLQDVGALLWPERLDDNLWPASTDYDLWPLGSTYQAWPGEVDAEPHAYVFRLRLAGGAVQGRVKQFKVHLDTREIHESVNDFLVEDVVHGNRVPLRNTYRGIVGVAFGLQQHAGYPLASTVKYVDKNAALGPLIRIFDSAGNPVAGVVDVDVWGY